MADWFEEPEPVNWDEVDEVLDVLEDMDYDRYVDKMLEEKDERHP